ncbi:ADP-ribosylglycohydrolase family protein [Acinetobacter baumannii]|uniref:ADP-ribosylglycohydrolase family protein n=1 Tax=Acinetobacter baumannii TaxID=470 RepID=UPI000DCFB378|nr:ADP-ribosylglycohydrolase family protein [Acinetobacter baumannii]MDO7494072.1 ADP-ribosylglycohydrolase family protein [Acinetobacter baumannii]
MTNETILNEGHSDHSTYEKMIISSAQWAAVGDALGWMTELAKDVSNIKFRTGNEKVNKTIPWKRNINGRQGTSVNFPAGIYSDDTQLRLSVCRAIRGDGTFDVEALAKIELTVWPSYALGGGVGTKTAANNLSRKGVTWFSNFFDKGDSKYIHGGGNGAAMRIQPHVWSCKNIDTMLLNILRDALVTHGHTHGFCGAIFHGLSLYETLQNKKIPNINSWRSFAEYFYKIPELLEKDPQLASFWLPTWEESTGKTLKEALEITYNEINNDINLIENLYFRNNGISYSDILDRLGCKTDKYRGSGIKTALVATALAFFYQDSKLEDVLVQAANELLSDTDTIATMVGAILGALENRLPEWELLDKEYITAEASRLARIALGKHESSFEYPDPAKWIAPSTQAAAVVNTTEGWAISGLGCLNVVGERYDYGNYSWQWFKLPFGQTILAKFKAKMELEVLNSLEIYRDNNNYLKKEITKSEDSTIARVLDEENIVQEVGSTMNINSTQNEIRRGDIRPNSLTNDKSVEQEVKQNELSFDKPLDTDNNYYQNNSYSVPYNMIDYMTDEVIRSNFDERLIGKNFNKIIDRYASLEQAIAFAAIIAKAKLARNRKRNH